MSLRIDMPYIGLLYAGACNIWKNSCSNSENFRVCLHFTSEFGKGGLGIIFHNKPDSVDYFPL